MAISTVVLEHSVDVTITTVAKTTGSLIVGADRLVLVFVCLVNGAATRTATVTGTGLSFTKVGGAEVLYDTNSNTLGIHWAVTGGGGFSNTLTITQNNSIQQMHWTVLEITGADNTTPVPQSVNNDPGAINSTYAPGTLGSPVNTDSRSFIHVGHNTFEGTTPGAGVTELADDPGNSPAQGYAVGWSNASWLAAPTMSGSAIAYGAQAIEVAAAAAGGGASSMVPWRRRPSGLLVR